MTWKYHNRPIYFVKVFLYITSDLNNSDNFWTDKLLNSANIDVIHFVKNFLNSISDTELIVKCNVRFENVCNRRIRASILLMISFINSK